MRAKRALSLFNNVPLRTRKVLSLYKVYGNSALLVFTRMLNSVNNFLVLSRRYVTSFEKSEIKSSGESQKGAITIQRCSIENQKGAIAVQSLW